MVPSPGAVQILKQEWLTYINYLSLPTSCICSSLVISLPSGLDLVFICKSWNIHKRLQKQYKTKNAGQPTYLPYFGILCTVALSVMLQK